MTRTAQITLLLLVCAVLVIGMLWDHRMRAERDCRPVFVIMSEETFL